MSHDTVLVKWYFKCKIIYTYIENTENTKEEKSLSCYFITKIWLWLYDCMIVQYNYYCIFIPASFMCKFHNGVYTVWIDLFYITFYFTLWPIVESAVLYVDYRCLCLLSHFSKNTPSKVLYRVLIGNAYIWFVYTWLQLICDQVRETQV